MSQWSKRKGSPVVSAAVHLDGVMAMVPSGLEPAHGTGLTGKPVNSLMIGQAVTPEGRVDVIVDKRHNACRMESVDEVIALATLLAKREGFKLMIVKE